MNANSLIKREVERMTLGKNVKKYRTLRKLSQRKLAQLTGMANSTISDIERDTKMPSVIKLKKLADALGCTTNDLLKE